MTKTEQLTRAILKKTGTARSRELVEAGIASTEISRMVAAGKLDRIARGVYALPGETSEHSALITVAKRAPNVVFCLLTALRFHDITTQAPFEVWIAIANKDHPPQLTYPPIRAVRLSAMALEQGVDRHVIDGVEIRVTNLARTIADCFKFRNKIGTDVALEALREARRANLVNADDLWRYAKLDRVQNVMRPYLEALM
jgi:predicted transcriptional regulator of viral defense system